MVIKIVYFNQSFLEIENNSYSMAPFGNNLGNLQNTEELLVYYKVSI